MCQKIGGTNLIGKSSAEFECPFPMITGSRWDEEEIKEESNKIVVFCMRHGLWM